MEELTIEEMTALKGGQPETNTVSQSIDQSPATAANLNFNIGGAFNTVTSTQDAQAKVFNIAKYITQNT